jgi:hypothetical protein
MSWSWELESIFYLCMSKFSGVLQEKIILG